MSYILAVAPNIMSDGTGMPMAGIFIATAVASGIACILMGVLANYPVGVAPGMGIIPLFTYTICIGMHKSWETALAAVFVSSIIFLIITVSGIRTYILNNMSHSLKIAIGVGIGFFIAFVGLKGSGIIVSSSSTLVALGNMSSPGVLLAVAGIFITLVLHIRKVPAAVFIGVLTTAVLGLIMGFMGLPGMPVITTSGVSVDFSTFGAFTHGFTGLFSNIPDLLVMVFSIVMVSFFDTTGTIIPLANQLGLVREDGTTEGIDEAFLADAASAIVGSVCGTSTLTAYVESATGIELGGRTGLTAVVIGILFILTIPVCPFIIGLFTSPVVAPALVVVGILMMMQIKDIDMSYLPTAATVFITVIMMILTYSITIGTAFGFITYFVSSIATGNRDKISKTMIVLVILFIVYLVWCT